jgi:transposase
VPHFTGRKTCRITNLDIAKGLFQVHGVDAVGQVVIRRQLKRRYVRVFFQKLPPCLIGMEACASSHHWSREPSGHVNRINRSYEGGSSRLGCPAIPNRRIY